MTGISSSGVQLNVANTWTAQQTAQGDTGTSPGWYAQITGDTTPRVRVGMNAADMASLALGPGNAVRDTFLERNAAATFQLGQGDVDTNAAIVAQTIRTQGALTGGTTNQAGKNFTFIVSPGKGTGAGGSFVIQTAPAGVSGSTPNAAVTVFAASATTIASTLPNTITTTTANQLSIFYDGSNSATFTVASNGNLTVAPTNNLNLNPVGLSGTLQTNGTTRFSWGTALFAGQAGTASAISQAGVSGTVPGLLPRKSATTTGWGASADNLMDAVVSGATQATFNATGLTMASGKDLVLGNAYVAGVQVPTGYIIIKDSAGTAYKVSCNV